MRSAKKVLLGLCCLGILMSIPESASAQAVLSMPIQTKIRQHHWHDSPHATGYPRFLPTMTMRKLDDLVKTVLKKGEKMLEGKGARAHRYTFRKAIGYTSSGQRSYSLKVITDEEGSVISAYPV